MLSFVQFIKEAESQAAISKSAKQNNVSLPGSFEAETGYTKKMTKTISKAMKNQRKSVPQVVF